MEDRLVCPCGSVGVLSGGVSIHLILCPTSKAAPAVPFTCLLPLKAQNQAYKSVVDKVGLGWMAGICDTDQRRVRRARKRACVLLLSNSSRRGRNRVPLVFLSAFRCPPMETRGITLAAYQLRKHGYLFVRVTQWSSGH